MTADVSRNTLFVLVVLTLVIALLGTWTVLVQINGGQAVSAPRGSQASGQVQLQIRPPPAHTETTGQVVFNIQQPH